MTLHEAITRADSLRPNVINISEKIRWLSHADGKLKLDLIDTHEGGDPAPFRPYTEDDLGRKLLIPYPYDDVYVYLLDMHVSYTMGEYTRYENAAQLYNAAMQAYRIHYNATHAPKQVRGRVL